MFHLAWLGVRHNPARYVATLVAIVTGVAFFSATGFLSDRVLDALQGDVDRQYSSVDAAVIVDDKGAAADFASKLRIAGPAADRIAATEGVEATAGVLTGSVAFRGADGKVFADGATGRLWIEDDDLNPVDVEEGAAPAAAGEIAVDKGLAKKHDLAVGDKVTLLTLAGPQEVTIVGITKFGSSDSIDGAAGRSRSRRRTRSTGSRRVRSSTRRSTSVARATRRRSSPRSSRPLPTGSRCRTARASSTTSAARSALPPST